MVLVLTGPRKIAEPKTASWAGTLLLLIIIQIARCEYSSQGRPGQGRTAIRYARRDPRRAALEADAAMDRLAGGTQRAPAPAHQRATLSLQPVFPSAVRRQ